MTVRPRHSSGLVHTTAVSWRYMAQRYSFVLFLALALGLLTLGRTNPLAVEQARVHMIDAMAPVLDALSRPMLAIENVTHQMASFMDVRKENERLRAENAVLMQWRTAAVAKENENRELRSLLNYKAEPGLAYISARVIADAGGAYVRSLIVTAGKTDGVREGMAAMTGEGLIGRVVEVGDWSSRILLITDLNSRIPVTVTDTGDHAILAGDNSPSLKLLYLPQDAILSPGARIVTSGHGGVFPPNLPVAVVTKAVQGAYEVEPLAALGRVNQVRLVDFDLKGGAFNPMRSQLDTGNATQ